MMEKIADLPAGVIGLHVSGELTREEYRDQLEPALRDAVEGGDVRLLLVLEEDFSMSAGAFAEDEKIGWQLVLPHHKAWKRIALVTDVDWVRRGIRLLGWMAPGEIKVWTGGELDKARAWVAD
jgi:SpoIIAA-like